VIYFSAPKLIFSGPRCFHTEIVEKLMAVLCCCRILIVEQKKRSSMKGQSRFLSEELFGGS